MISELPEWPWAPIQPDTNDAVAEETTAHKYVTTAYYPKVVEIIKEIKKYQHLFLNSSVVETGFTHDRMIEGGTDAVFPFGKITYAKGLSFLIAHHEMKGTEFYVFVNCHSTIESLLTVESYYNLQELTGRNPRDPYEGTIPPGPLSDKDQKANTTDLLPTSPRKYATLVEPGDWRIFVVRH